MTRAEIQQRLKSLEEAIIRLTEASTQICLLVMGLAAAVDAMQKKPPNNPEEITIGKN